MARRGWAAWWAWRRWLPPAPRTAGWPCQRTPVRTAGTTPPGEVAEPMGTTPVPGAAGPAAAGQAGQDEELLGIGAAAARVGVSERALRYYRQLGLLVPACTPGGLRRYSRPALARVARCGRVQPLPRRT